MAKKARIIGTGSYLPERVLTNKDFEKMVDTTEEWIITRTGMRERRIAADGEYTSNMGYKAAKNAIEAAGIEASDLDLILVATLTPDYIFPSTGALIQAELGIKAPAFDLQAACTGYLYALSVAKGYIESGTYNTILIVASEKLSSIVDYTDRRTCVLFGDGAGAAIVSSQGEGLAVHDTCLGCDGEAADLLILKGGGSRNPASAETIEQRMHYISMQGKEVFKHAVRRMECAAIECLQKAQKTKDDINWFVPHQANERIIDAIARRFSVPERKIFKTIHKYGNTSASGIAIALDELIREQDIKQGENLLLVAFGAGFTWGASLLTKVNDE